MFSVIRLLLHPFSLWCKRWIVLRLLGVWFCITHTWKIIFQLIVYAGLFWKSNIKKLTCWNALLSCTHISYEAVGKKKYSIVSCVVCFFQNRENIFCCGVTETAILKAGDQTGQNYTLMFYGPWQFFVRIIATLKIYFERSTTTISQKSRNN